MYHYHHTDFSLFNSNRWSIFIKYFAKYELSKNDLKRKLFLSFASKRRITFVTSVLFLEKCKNSHKFIRRVQYYLKLTGYPWIMAKGEISQKKKKKKKKIEGVPIRRCRPVPLKVVWMGFEPLINVLKGLISNQSNSEAWVFNDGKFIPNVLLRNKSIL